MPYTPSLGRRNFGGSSFGAKTESLVQNGGFEAETIDAAAVEVEAGNADLGHRWHTRWHTCQKAKTLV
jgi:hypothetical protein